MDIDLILLYVDCSREKWQSLYRKTCWEHNRNIIETHRYRENIPLKYLLRAINENCPFIRTLFLIVQDRDQVPEYVKESEHLKIIEHKDIIPEKLLPTYNSNTIEMYMYNIPELSEHFIHINDDMYPCKEMMPSDFFDDSGNPKIKIIRKHQSPNQYRETLKNSELLVKDVLGIKDKIISNIWYYRDCHSWNPMLKSIWQELHNKKGNVIRSKSTKFRQHKNLTQQMCTYYSYFSNRYSERDIKTEYFSFSYPISDILTGLDNNHIVCINDTMTHASYDRYVKILLEWFKNKYPKKSIKYEI